MKLALELITRRPTSLRLGTFFETWIATHSGTVRHSLGRDEYHLGLRLDAGKRIAATGRTHICQVDLADAGLGDTEARPAALAPAEVEPATRAAWGIRTNLYLDFPSLMGGARAILIREGAEPSEFGFDHPHLLVETVAPGRYIVDISAMLL